MLEKNNKSSKRIRGINDENNNKGNKDKLI
jgi:hypothetical protein